MQEVFFVKKGDLTNVQKILKNELSKVFSKGERIAVKLHMGERGNKYFVRPSIVKKIIKVMKDLGLEPFLFDSCTAYAGRDTPEKYYKIAEEHGFSEIGCSVKVGNEGTKVKTENMVVRVCNDLIKADGMLVLSHVKGHPCSGFGGAIKNLGMGGVVRESKALIHSYAEPKFNKNKCTACGTCFKVCPANAIELKPKAVVDYRKCWNCDICVVNCPYNAIKPKIALMDKLLAEGAKGVLDNVKKVYFVNWIANITKLCDCHSDPQGILMDDIGFVFSNNIIAADKASFDLINEKAGMDFFKAVHRKSPLLHIEEGVKLGMGKLKYKLNKIN